MEEWILGNSERVPSKPLDQLRSDLLLLDRQQWIDQLLGSRLFIVPEPRA